MSNVSTNMSVRNTPFVIRVLVVEDSRPFQGYVCDLLARKTGIHVVGRAQDGVQAIQCAQELTPDLILLDIGLPLMNGIEVAKRVLRFAPKCRIIFLTQESGHEFVEEAFKLGAVGYILKTRINQDLWPTMVNAFAGTEWSQPAISSVMV